MKYLLLITLLLTGCGSEEGRNNYGYGYSYDQSGETGLRVRYMPGQSTPTLAQIEDIYSQVMACSGITATGPLVIFIDSFPEDSRIGGKTFYGTGTVVVATFGFPDADRVTLVLRHEFAHYLLSQSGYDQARNTAHDSPLFGVCSDGINLSVSAG